VDAGSLFGTAFDARFVLAVIGIILIDLVLAGDNAVVIAMAVRHLPGHQKRKGIILGAGAAVLLRIVATFFVAQLLTIPLVKLAGGAAVLWIAVQLFAQNGEEDEAAAAATSLWQAVRLIVVADISLSIDNMLAVGGASHGNLVLLVFGLVVSVPFVVFASGLLSRLMASYPLIVVAGAALLGKVGAEMIATDPAVRRLLALEAWSLIAVQVAGALAVIGMARWLRQGDGRRQAARALSITSETL
jgi:YjbE family integral membrane protein